VVLLEIGVWRTASQLFGSQIKDAQRAGKLPKSKDVYTALLGLAKMQLGKEMGESVMDDKLSYVYKRVHKDFKYPSDETRAIRALISEISILGHSMVRGHPNIVRLVGICWDIVSRTEPVWPVLVFQKATHRDLHRFMKSDQGKQLDTKARLKLCKEIAAAITSMHSIGKSSVSEWRSLISVATAADLMLQALSTAISNHRTF
jgi:serine/threonine protein kinase